MKMVSWDGEAYGAAAQQMTNWDALDLDFETKKTRETKWKKRIYGNELQ